MGTPGNGSATVLQAVRSASNGGPWWAKLLVQAPFLAIAAGLIYWMTQRLDTAVVQMQTNQVTIQQRQQQLSNELQAHGVDTSFVTMRLERLVGLTRALCVNAATNETQRDRCLQGD